MPLFRIKTYNNNLWTHKTIFFLNESYLNDNLFLSLQADRINFIRTLESFQTKIYAHNQINPMYNCFPILILEV